jgi:hypothetical protein
MPSDTNFVSEDKGGPSLSGLRTLASLDLSLVSDQALSSRVHLGRTVYAFFLSLGQKQVWGKSADGLQGLLKKGVSQSVLKGGHVDSFF